MSDSLYQQLTAIREQKRPKVKAVPRDLKGVMLPAAAGSGKDTPLSLLEEGAQIWNKVVCATALDACEALGWETYVNLMGEHQRPVYEEGYKSHRTLIEQYGVEGDSVLAATTVMVAHAMGCGFNYTLWSSWSEKLLQGTATWCGMVDCIRDMGMAHKAQNVRYWCDAFDYPMAHSVNPSIWMTHSHCPLNGDKYCRFHVQELDTPPQGESYYEKIKNLNDEMHARTEEAAPTPELYQGMAAPRFIESLSPEYLAEDGVVTLSRMSAELILMAVSALGWEKYLEILSGDQSWGYEKLAVKMRTDHQILGNELRSAGIALAYNYLTMGFKDHHLIEFNNERVEGIGHTCPLVEHGRRMGMDDALAEMSLWCDFFHNHAVHAVNPDFQLCHTHCLARGDQYCRFVLEAGRA